MEISAGMGLLIIGGAFAVLGSSLGALAQGIAASSGARELSRNQKTFGKTLVLAALPETQSIYGLLVAILLLSSSGLITGQVKEVSVAAGLMALGAGISIGLAAPASAIAQGMAASAAIGAVAGNEKTFGKALVLAAVTETQAIYGLLVSILLIAFSGLLSETMPNIPIGTGMLGLAAGLAVGIAAIGSVWGQGIAASAAIGVVSRKEELFGKGIVFAALPETQAIYGLLVAILLITFGGFMGNISDIPLSVGVATIGAALSIGLAGFSALGQGLAAARGITNTAKYPKSFGHGITFAAICETQAIYSLLVAILIIAGVGLLEGTYQTITLVAGCALAATGLMMGFVAGQSAVGQGMVAAQSIDTVAKDPKTFGKALAFTILPETQAIYALLLVVLILISLKLL